MFDFKTITASTDRYNFHAHTQFCDGRATMAEFADAAVDAGFLHWGFTPHSPITVESPCNMSRDNVPVFLDEVRRLQKLHDGRISFYAAMEIDYLGPQCGPALGYFQDLPLDYRIGSVHFVPTRRGEYVDIDGRFESFRRKMAQYFDDDINYVVNAFYDQSLAMLAAGGFDIIGHYDKIGHNAAHFRPGIEQEGWYQDRVNELTDAIIDSGITVEINTKARAEHGRFFPSMEHWDRLLDAGVTITVNSDAHYTDLINASRDEALQLIKRAPR